MLGVNSAAYRGRCWRSSWDVIYPAEITKGSARAVDVSGAIPHINIICVIEVIGCMGIDPFAFPVKEEILDDFYTNWNETFPNYPLTAAVLKNPHAFMGAFFQLFDRLGIDRDAVLMAPPEDSRDEHTIYYWDLLPVINMTRIYKFLISALPNLNMLPITIMNFLQPTVNASQSMLILLFNLMLFYENGLRDIAPCEDELFSKKEQLKMLEDRKNKLLEMLNEQAEEKGKRAERLEKLDIEIQQLTEEIKLEKEASDKEKQELEAVLENKHQIEIMLDQKKTHRDNLLDEVARKRALRVYDADDIKAQAEQAEQKVQEAEERFQSLTETLMQKENSSKNLQTIKLNLDSANNLLHEIMKLWDSIKECEAGDFECESPQGGLEAVKNELDEVRSQLAELQATRREAANARAEAYDRRQQTKLTLNSALREAEENEKKCCERSKMATQRTQEIKEATVKYEEKKVTGTKTLEMIKDNFINELKSFEEVLIKKAKEAESRIEDKLQYRHE